MTKTMLLLADGFEAVEASVFSDVLGWNRFEGDGSTEVVTVGMRERLRCTWNFSVIPEALLDEVDVQGFDALAIPGGFEEAGFYSDAFSEPFLDVIRAFDAAGKPIAAICVASLALGKSGILKGRRATTYNLGGGKRQRQLSDLGAVCVPDEPIVVDGNVITSYNPSTAFGVAFALLERLTTSGNCTEVKRLMGFE
ncbi:MAG: DJ-1/PfpI family protein [Syntrophales bacterium]|nr:DJ-1/PfpI family protein [Syntrophales bacterium]